MLSRGLRKKLANGKEKKGRVCSECTLCCTYLKIESRIGYSTRLDTGEDIAKSAGVPCRYLGPDGCLIYEVRPSLCRQFACDWLSGGKGFLESPLKTKVIGIRGEKIKIE